MMDYQTIQTYLRTLVPERIPEVQEMETFADETHFPIIGPAAGTFCYLIARLMGARKIFELGSGYGYSTYWFAKAVKENGGGEVHHVVWDEGLSQKAKIHLEKLGYGNMVYYHVGEAVETLKKSEGPYDLIFNDIDKEGYPGALPVIEQKLRPGGALIVDNMLWQGRIFDEKDEEPSTRGIREFSNQVSQGKNWISSVIPIRDGVLLAYRR